MENGYSKRDIIAKTRYIDYQTIRKSRIHGGTLTDRPHFTKIPMPESSRNVCNEIIDILKNHSPDSFEEGFSILSTLFAALGTKYLGVDDFKQLLDDMKNVCDGIQKKEDENGQ